MEHGGRGCGRVVEAFGSKFFKIALESLMAIAVHVLFVRTQKAMRIDYIKSIRNYAYKRDSQLMVRNSFPASRETQ